jgi:hypothetical protein
VIEWEPTKSDEVSNVAMSLDMVADPKVVDPSLNVTVPLAFGNCSVALNCTFPPNTPVLGVAMTVRAFVVAEPGPLSEGVKKIVNPGPLMGYGIGPCHPLDGQELLEPETDR